MLALKRLPEKHTLIKLAAQTNKRTIDKECIATCHLDIFMLNDILYVKRILFVSCHLKPLWQLVDHKELENAFDIATDGNWTWIVLANSL